MAHRCDDDDDAVSDTLYTHHNTHPGGANPGAPPNAPGGTKPPGAPPKPGAPPNGTPPGGMNAGAASLPYVMAKV
jgi:hypothetical protein